MVEFLDKYFLYIWLVMVIGIFSFLFIRGMSLMLPFKKLKDENILFSQRFTSAKSLNPMKKNKGGSGKILHIIVTDHNLLLKTSLLFTYFADRVDLLQIIPIESIIETRTEKKTFFSRLYVKYRKSDGTTNEIALMSTKNNIIEKMIKQNTNNRGQSTAKVPHRTSV